MKPPQTNSFLCPQDLEEYKYTCEPGHMEWTPLNSNLTMQGIKASIFFHYKELRREGKYFYLSLNLSGLFLGLLVRVVQANQFQPHLLDRCK